MKFRLYVLMFILFGCTLQSSAQYKDLEGVFFGKVIAFGVGGSVHAYKDKLIGTTLSVTPITYSVLLNNKRITTMRVGMHQKFNAVYNGNDGFNNYTKTIDRKIWEYELAYKFALTKDGLDKPTSVFLNLQTGILFGKQTVTDTRWGTEDDKGNTLIIGGGLSVFQRFGSRLILFAEPSYRVDISPKTSKVYFDDANAGKYLSLTHLSGHVGIMFLIGKSN